MLLAPVHGLSPPIVSITTDHDACVWPVQSEVPHQPAQMGTYFRAAWRIPGAQNGQHAIAGIGII